jgi:uncharacterized protein
VVHRSLALRADGALGDDEGKSGSRTLMVLGAGLNRVQTSETDPSSSLVWDSEPLAQDLDVVGGIELQLDAVSTAADTAWIAILQDVGEAGIVTDVTAGYLRAGLREVDEAASHPGAPDLPCRTFQAVPIGEPLRYRIPLVANARRFRAGHRVRLFLTSEDQDPNMPALLTFRHSSVGTSCLNTVRSSSQLVLPVVSG